MQQVKAPIILSDITAQVTENLAETIAEVARSLQEREAVELADAKSRAEMSFAQRKNLRIARFLNRIAFCFFAEDTGLLPKKLFSEVLKTGVDDLHHFAETLEKLFKVMAKGGTFGKDKIRHFNGHLFEESTVFELTEDELRNREVLKRVQHTGGIFFAESDRPWILDGANVHVSLIGFDDGTEIQRVLNGHLVSTINSNLTGAADTTKAGRLKANEAIGFIADVKAGKFDLSESDALEMLHRPNPHGRPNSDVLLPWINSLDILRRPRNWWIVDFGSDVSLELASRYESPFALVRKLVLPARSLVKRKSYRDYWWIHAEPCSEMRERIAPLSRFLVTTTVSKHRIFAWKHPPTLPDHQLVAFGRDDDFFFGLLHSRLHQVWALAQGTQLREKESGFRYTPTTCFETFPFPLPTPEQEAAIAAASKSLNELRERWLNPPEWTVEKILEFPGSVGGLCDRYIVGPLPSAGAGPSAASGDAAYKIGLVRYPRLEPRDAECAAKLKKRTLTNLYNERPAWLDLAHKKLDAAVAAAYGWNDFVEILEHTGPGQNYDFEEGGWFVLDTDEKGYIEAIEKFTKDFDERILERLLALNLERAAEEEKAAKVKKPNVSRAKRRDEML